MSFLQEQAGTSTVKRAVKIFKSSKTQKYNVKKLCLSDWFSTDPFEIGNSEKLFYSKLSSRQIVNLNSEHAKSSLKLSDQLSYVAKENNFSGLDYTG